MSELGAMLALGGLILCILSPWFVFLVFLGLVMTYG
jgi:hypothetical protein